MHKAVEACFVTGANLGQPLGTVALNTESVANMADVGWRSHIGGLVEAHGMAINAMLDPHENRIV